MKALSLSTLSLATALAALPVSLLHAQTIQLEVIAEAGDPAAGTPGNYATIGSVAVNANGEAIVLGTATGGGIVAGNDSAIWHGTAGSLSLMAREGSAAPGATGNFNVLRPLGISLAGEGVIGATFNGTAPSGFWNGAGGTTNYIAASALAAPGIPGAVFASATNALTSVSASSNDSGQIAFRAILEVNGTTVTSSTATTIYLTVGGAPTLVARRGSVVQGLAPATFSQDPGDFMVLNNLGYLAMHAPGGNNGLLVRDPGTGDWSTLQARNSTAGPGIVFAGFRGMAFNDNNETLFCPTLSGVGITATVNDQGVWFRDSLGTLTKLAQMNDPAPGIGGGVNYGVFEELYLSNTGGGGQVRAFQVTLKDGGVTAANDKALFADYGSGVQVIAREGVTSLTSGPGGTSGVITQIVSVTMNLDGEILMHASIGASEGVWKRGNQPGDIFEPVLTVGESVYDETNVLRTVNAVSFTRQSTSASISQGSSPVGRTKTLNESNDIALLVRHTGNVAGGAYFPRPASALLTAVAVGGMEPPGVAGARYQTIRSGAVINDNDQVAFRAHLLRGFGPIGTSDFHGVWGQVGDVVNFIARNGVATPAGAPAGAVWQILDQNPAWSNTQTAAFNAPLLAGLGGVTSTDRWGTWAGQPGALSLVARASNTVIPGTAAGTELFFPFFFAASNDLDSVVSRAVFRRTLGGVVANDDSAVLRLSPTVALLARENQAIPGQTGVFDDFSSTSPGALWHNDSGETVFKSRAKTSALTGVFLHNGTALSTYAYSGNAVPGFPGLTYLEPSVPVLSDTFVSGSIPLPPGAGPVVAYHSTLSGAVTPGVDDQAILLGYTAALPTIAVRTGIAQSAGTYGPVGVDPTDTFASLSLPHISQDGNLLFRGRLAIQGATTAANDGGVWRIKDGNLELVVREGSPAPDTLGAPTTASFAEFGPGDVNGLPTAGNLGRLGFVASVTGPGITAANDTGVYVMESTGTLRRVVQEGDVLTVPNADTVTRSVTVSGVSFGSWHQTLPNQQRQIGATKMVLTLEFTDGTSGVFTSTLP